MWARAQTPEPTRGDGARGIQSASEGSEISAPTMTATASIVTRRVISAPRARGARSFTPHHDPKNAATNQTQPCRLPVETGAVPRSVHQPRCAAPRKLPMAKNGSASGMLAQIGLEARLDAMPARKAMIDETVAIMQDEVAKVPLYVEPLVWAARDGIDLVQRPDNFFMLRWVNVK
jgi:hypothetical protein